MARHGLVIYLKEDEVICRNMFQKEYVICSTIYSLQASLYKYYFPKLKENTYVQRKRFYNYYTYKYYECYIVNIMI